MAQCCVGDGTGGVDAIPDTVGDGNGGGGVVVAGGVVPCGGATVEVTVGDGAGGGGTWGAGVYSVVDGAGGRELSAGLVP